MKKLSLTFITLTAAVFLPLWFAGQAGAAVIGTPARSAISAAQNSGRVPASTNPVLIADNADRKNPFSSSKDNKCKSRKEPPHHHWPPPRHHKPLHHEPPPWDRQALPRI